MGTGLQQHRPFFWCQELTPLPSQTPNARHHLVACVLRAFNWVPACERTSKVNPTEAFLNWTNWDDVGLGCQFE